MNEDVATLVARDLAAAMPGEVAAVAAILAGELGGVAVLFYGSVLRTGDLDAILDFYVLTTGLHGPAWRRLASRWLWPDVSYHEIAVGGRTVRAKVATMPLSTFERANAGGMLDTTIWTRFVQPAGLAWSRDAVTTARVGAAITAAVVTAARFAAALGPETGRADEYWRALLRETYRAELRVEQPGREEQILQHDLDRYRALLPAAWAAGGVAFEQEGGVVRPHLTFDQCRVLVQAWLVRVRAGKSLNLARLVKATFTFQGAARYGLYKVERHTGIRVALTPWRERHPILAAPGVLWRVLRARPRARAALATGRR